MTKPEGRAHAEFLSDLFLRDLEPELALSEEDDDDEEEGALSELLFCSDAFALVLERGFSDFSVALSFDSDLSFVFDSGLLSSPKSHASTS